VKSLQIDRSRAHFGFVASENTCRALKNLATPLRNMVGMNVELLRRSGQRLLAPAETKAFRRDRGLNPDVWFRRVSFVIFAPYPPPFSPPSGRKSTYRPVQFSEASPLSSETGPKDPREARTAIVPFGPSPTRIDVYCNQY
jgi:hypothetical protein